MYHYHIAYNVYFFYCKYFLLNLIKSLDELETHPVLFLKMEIKFKFQIQISKTCPF
jgi:hypothetical protein